MIFKKITLSLLFSPILLLAFNQDNFLKFNDSKITNNEKIKKKSNDFKLQSILIDLKNKKKDRKDLLLKLKRLADKENSEKASFYYAALIENINPKESIEYYKKAIFINPLYKEAIYNLGVLYLKLNNKNDAISNFVTAYQLGVKESALPLAELTDNKALYKEAIKNNIKNSKTLYIKYLIKELSKNNNKEIKNEIGKYAKEAYEDRESYIFYAKYLFETKKTKEAFSVLSEGIIHKDVDSSILLSSIILKTSPLEVTKILKNINTKEALKLKAEAYYLLGDFKSSLLNINSYKTAIKDKNIEDESLIFIYSKICDETNYCLGF